MSTIPLRNKKRSSPKMKVFLGALSSVAMLCVGVTSAQAETVQKGEIIGEPAGPNATTVSNHHVQPTLSYISEWADASGATHFTHCRIENEKFKSYAPPAAPQWIGVSPDKIESISYAALPVGYEGSWHHAPSPQWVITLAGKWSVETTDGKRFVQGPGEMQFNDDSNSHPRKDDAHVGHVSKTVGNVPNEQLIIKLKPGTRLHQKGHCVY